MRSVFIEYLGQRNCRFVQPGVLLLCGWGNSVLPSKSIATVTIIQVVPHFGGVDTITAPGRSANLDHLAASVQAPEKAASVETVNCFIGRLKRRQYILEGVLSAIFGALSGSKIAVAVIRISGHDRAAMTAGFPSA